MTLLTLARASELVSTPVKTLYAWIADGRLPAYKPGRNLLVEQADLAALVERSRVVVPCRRWRDGQQPASADTTSTTTGADGSISATSTPKVGSNAIKKPSRREPQPAQRKRGRAKF